ncbi:uncharacterized protein FA14DRAFT_46410 [Meira miltonrushii]|uniref:Uncharacterized protein n=1 Tax=Meira miltonrushii TaxID=1280837 RepID=A0A316VIB7_9BASI|nr:uncharacterized protein FA14DRAFT_46410 [Meira miltonrushii]PWN35751.1 hypothetical protein FA14DRAFT_46410 [Meira miltonrushii]
MYSKQSRNQLISAVPHAGLWAVLALSNLASAASVPSNSHTLEKRKPVLKDSGLVTIDGKAPLDLILLIAATMGFALFCLILVCINLRKPWVGGSKEISEERTRARTDLRLRGAGKRFVIDRRPTHRVLHDSSMSHATVDSKSHLIAPMHNPDAYNKSLNYVGPKIAQDQPSRAARGYSYYSKADLAANAAFYQDGQPRMVVGGPRRPNQPSMLSTLAVPTLNAGDGASDTSSTAFSSPDPSTSGVKLSDGSSGKGNGMPTGPRPIPAHARQKPTRQNTTSSQPEQGRRISSTSAGALRWYERNQRGDVPPVPPSMADRAYMEYDRTSPTRNGGNGQRYALHRSNTDGQGHGSPVRSSSYFDGSGSESHEGSGANTPSMQHLQHPLQPNVNHMLPRTRVLAHYDLDSDPNANHLTGLLDERQVPTTSNTAWRGYR